MPLVEKANVRMRWWWRVSRSCGNVDGPPNFQEVSLAHVLDWLLHSGSLVQEEVEISVVGPSLRVPCFQGIYFGHADDDDVSFAFGFWTDVSLKRLLTKVALEELVWALVLRRHEHMVVAEEVEHMKVV